MIQPPFVPSPPSQAEIQSARMVFRSAEYIHHNARRLEHLASLGLNLSDRTVLEVGAGIGDHTTFFLDRGCTVVSTEPRAANCRLFADMMTELARGGYVAAMRSRLVNSDVNSIGQAVEGTFDIVYCYGLLYHLKDPASAIELMSSKAADLLLIETCVSRGRGEAVNPVSENAVNASQAIEGMGCRPTRSWVFQQLLSFFPHVYMPRTQPAHAEFPLDWTKIPTRPLTRAIFIASRQPLANQNLLDHIPDHQTLT